MIVSELFPSRTEGVERSSCPNEIQHVLKHIGGVGVCVDFALGVVSQDSLFSAMQVLIEPAVPSGLLSAALPRRNSRGLSAVVR